MGASNTSRESLLQLELESDELLVDRFLFFLSPLLFLFLPLLLPLFFFPLLCGNPRHQRGSKRLSRLPGLPFDPQLPSCL